MDRQVKGILGAKLGMTQVWDNNNGCPGDRGRRPARAS